MRIEKARNRRCRYFALGEDSLRNGSFIRASRYGGALFINGNYMGMHCEAGRGQPLEVPDDRTEFEYKIAEGLIPGVCK